jgi:hypothetical protein
MASVAAASVLAEDALAAQPQGFEGIFKDYEGQAAAVGSRPLQEGLLVHPAVSGEALERARSIIQNATADTDNVKAAVEVGKAICLMQNHKNYVVFVVAFFIDVRSDTATYQIFWKAKGGERREDPSTLHNNEYYFVTVVSQFKSKSKELFTCTVQ